MREWQLLKENSGGSENKTSRNHCGFRLFTGPSSAKEFETLGFVKPNQSPAQWVRFGKMEQGSGRMMLFFEGIKEHRSKAIREQIKHIRFAYKKLITSLSADKIITRTLTSA